MIRPALQLVAYGELAFCWVAWSAAFIQPFRKSARQRLMAKNPAARWGMLLNVLGCVCIWSDVRPTGFQKSMPELIASMVLGPLSVILAWSATRHLGKFWRYEAALNANHELVKTGPYAWIRHPIYLSMLGMLLASGAAYSWWPTLIVGVLLFLIGAEIRTKAEDKLLEMYFQDEFIEYRARVRSSYIPLIR
jgi:protein-S-isoprenylcysteine O-methyltransferase Ste14